MKTQPGLDRALAFVNCHLQPGSTAVAVKQGLAHRAVTISRETGSGAHVVAEKLAALLQAKTPAEACPWTVFDRNLVDKVVQEHDLPERVARFMREDRISAISDTMEELFGLHPPTWELLRKVTETILHLVELGNVIIIGRGGALVTANLKHVFHVRLVCPLEKRIQHLQEMQKMSREAALKLIEEADRGRERYLKKNFNRDINDPLLYDLVLNTHRVSYDTAARIIADGVLSHG
jgi:cytidylate kinase